MGRFEFRPPSVATETRIGLIIEPSARLHKQGKQGHDDSAQLHVKTPLSRQFDAGLMPTPCSHLSQCDITVALHRRQET